MKGRKTKFSPALARVSASKNNYESTVILINQKLAIHNGFENCFRLLIENLHIDVKCIQTMH